MADRPNPRRARMLALAVAGAVWAAALVGRLVDLQVRQHAFLQDKAEAQQERVMKIAPMRGFIYDRRGEVLAASTEVESVFAAPTEIKNPAATAAILAEVLGGDAKRYLPRLTTKGAFVWIKRKVGAAEAQALKSKAPAGIYLMPESKRLYPKGSLAAHVLGYVGLDGDGLAGLELHYDRFIEGSPGLMLALRDARGSQYRHWVRRPPVHGMDLTLTLDEVAQHIAEREIERCRQETGARGVMALVIDPNSGRVLALANAPTFDPNAFADGSRESWRNRAILDAFEPGSTFKTITAAGALDRGLVKPWEQIFCENGGITIGRDRVADHDPYGWLTFREVISKSSNVGAIKVGLRIPPADFYRDIRGFGFGARLGIDLPGEATGILNPPERWAKIDQACMSMGQGVSATPLQMVMALTAIGNGGTLYRPYVVERITGPDGTTWMKNEPRVLSHPLTPATAAILADIMKGVVTDGTGKAAVIPGLEVAGKTGTAQKPDRHGYGRKFMSSFIGFVPAHEPRLCIGVFVDEPQGKHFGGQVAAPVFKRIAEPVLRSMGIPVGLVGSDAEEIVESSVGSMANLVRVYVPEPKDQKQIRTDVPGWKPATPAAPAPPEPIASVLASPPSDPGRVPNLVGQSLRDALRIARDAGLSLEADGSGVAVRQEPPAGTLLADPRPITVHFEGG